MRSEQELLDIVYERAEGLRTTRRNRAALALGGAVSILVAAAAIAGGSIGDRDRSLTAGPTIGDVSSVPSELPPTGAGHMEITTIGLDVELLAGVSAGALERGAGIYPETPAPGHPGNSAIAGHRTSHGAPFERLVDLEPGDRIVITTTEGEFTYEVRESLTVEASDVAVIGSSFWRDRWGGQPNTLTLTTEASDTTQRLVIGAELLTQPVPDSSAP